MESSTDNLLQSKSEFHFYYLYLRNDTLTPPVRHEQPRTNSNTPAHEQRTPLWFSSSVVITGRCAGFTPESRGVDVSINHSQCTDSEDLPGNMHSILPRLTLRINVCPELHPSSLIYFTWRKSLHCTSCTKTTYTI